MCGGHRRKPASEDNEEEEPSADTTTSASGESNTGQAFMLSSLKPANGKFVLGPPVETNTPVVVFTGPADRPDTVVQTARAKPKKKKKSAAKAGSVGKAANVAKPTKPAKRKVSSAGQ